MTKAFEELEKFTEENVAWRRGVGFEWTCEALIDPQLLADLIYLASHAPRKLRSDVLDGNNLIVLPEEGD